jgi:hypothetical protein
MADVIRRTVFSRSAPSASGFDIFAYPWANLYIGIACTGTPQPSLPITILSAGYSHISAIVSVIRV